MQALPRRHRNNFLLALVNGLQQAAPGLMQGQQFRQQQEFQQRQLDNDTTDREFRARQAIIDQDYRDKMLAQSQEQYATTRAAAEAQERFRQAMLGRQEKAREETRRLAPFQAQAKFYEGVAGSYENPHVFAPLIGALNRGMELPQRDVELPGPVDPRDPNELQVPGVASTLARAGRTKMQVDEAKAAAKERAMAERFAAARAARSGDAASAAEAKAFLAAYDDAFDATGDSERAAAEGRRAVAAFRSTRPAPQVAGPLTGPGLAPDAVPTRPAASPPPFADPNRPGLVVPLQGIPGAPVTPPIRTPEMAAMELQDARRGDVAAAAKDRRDRVNAYVEGVRNTKNYRGALIQAKNDAMAIQNGKLDLEQQKFIAERTLKAARLDLDERKLLAPAKTEDPASVLLRGRIGRLETAINKARESGDKKTIQELTPHLNDLITAWEKVRESSPGGGGSGGGSASGKSNRQRYIDSLVAGGIPQAQAAQMAKQRYPGP